MNICIFNFQYHPDHIVNEKSSESKVQKAHDTFVKINEAYEILSSPKKRELYDLGLSRLGAEAIIKRHTKQGKKGKFVDLSQMSREERAAAMGYNVDPNFWSGETDRYLIAGACVVVIIVGFVIHYAIANISYQRHADELNRITKEINAHEKKVKDAAMEVIPGYDGNSSIRNFVMRMDNENGDALKKYEERRKKIAEARKAKALLLEEKTVVAGDQETQVNWWNFSSNQKRMKLFVQFLIVPIKNAYIFELETFLFKNAKLLVSSQIFIVFMSNIISGTVFPIIMSYSFYDLGWTS